MNDFLDSLDFLKDEDEIKSSNKSIEILVVDDNEDVHKITELILVDFTYQDYDFIISHAYSGKELSSIMESKNNVAIILLDVVMETDSAGLDVVKYIREDLKNEFVRIVLRTGQPGKAPEDDIIRNYDINNYIAKTDGSVQKIYTALYSAIRSYRDLVKIYYSKIGLEKVVEASKELYKYKSLMSFYEGILFQLSNLLDFNDNAFIASENYKMSGTVLHSQNNEETILAGIGNFKNLINRNIKDIFTEEILQGSLKLGDKLPSVKDIKVLMGVGHVTAANALQNLSKKGYVKTIRGRGSFVCKLPDAQKTSGIITYAFGHGVSPELTSFYIDDVRGRDFYASLSQ